MPPALKRATIAAIVVGSLARIAVLAWDDPWGPHHPDEHILPLEALALWEGVTPREIGWPASTTRLLLSGSLAIKCAADTGAELWRSRRQPERALETVARWIADKYVDPRPLYRMGRIVSVVTGILQLVVLGWTLRQWVGPVGMAIGTLSVAISPLAVLYSQFVLADITALTLATVAVGLAAAPTQGRLIAAAAFIGLASATKFHFALWLVAPLMCVWTATAQRVATRMRVAAVVIASAVWIVLTLVPWFWLNPLLALKEFAGVVVVKVATGSPIQRIPRNVVVLFGGLGIVTWLGAIAGVAVLRDRMVARRFSPVWAPLLIGTLVLVPSAVVFDRYALVLLPGVAIVSALGWEHLLAGTRPAIRRISLVALAACVISTIAALWTVERRAAEADVDTLVRNWIRANAPPGSRVGVHDESNAFLPRSEAQLRECVARADQPVAYVDKWAIEGVHIADAPVQPMRSMVLNDELFAAYWCRRELTVGRNDGLYIVTYHHEPRFGSLLEREAINRFRAPADARSDRIDLLVLNREVDVGVPPAAVLQTRRGRRVIYGH